MKHYRSSIPKTAREHVTATFATNQQKRTAEYILNGKLVGIRHFHETGELEYENPLRNGLLHGIVYRSDIPGKILSATPYFKGFLHGTAKQWSNDGKLIGTYTMKHGTGIDLWWNPRSDNGLPYLSEVHYYKKGKRHGFEWWLNEDQTVSVERHWRDGELHGIYRRWNQKGRLDRGYPTYWVNDARVTKTQYVRACADDPTRPRFRETDNRPQRRFPSGLMR